MHILLTDVLSCPRCGPEHGLVLMAESIVERRVGEGVLGCPDCRTRYPIRGGVPDLRVLETGAAPDGEASGRAPAPGVQGEEAVAEDAVRLAALLGLGERKGMVLMVGSRVELGGAMVAVVPEVQVVVLGPEVEASTESRGVTRVLADGRLPFRTGVLDAVVLAGDAAQSLEPEGVRVLGRGGRLVLEGVTAGAADRLRVAGFTVLVEESGVVVAQKAQ